MLRVAHSLLKRTRSRSSPANTFAQQPTAAHKQRAKSTLCERKHHTAVATWTALRATAAFNMNQACQHKFWCFIGTAAVLRASIIRSTSTPYSGVVYVVVHMLSCPRRYSGVLYLYFLRVLVPVLVPVRGASTESSRYLQREVGNDRYSSSRLP